MQAIIKYPKDTSTKASLSTYLRRKGFTRDQVILVSNGDKATLEKLVAEYGGEMLGFLSQDITEIPIKNILSKLLSVFVKIAQKGIRALDETDFKIVEEAEKLCQ